MENNLNFKKNRSAIIFQNLSDQINSGTYPNNPNKNAKKCRQMFKLDYKMLLDQGMVPFRSQNDFVNLE